MCSYFGQPKAIQTIQRMLVKKSIAHGIVNIFGKLCTKTSPFFPHIPGIQQEHVCFLLMTVSGSQHNYMYKVSVAPPLVLLVNGVNDIRLSSPIADLLRLNADPRFDTTTTFANSSQVSSQKGGAPMFFEEKMAEQKMVFQDFQGLG